MVISAVETGLAEGGDHFVANPFCLLLAQAAHILMLKIREAAAGTPWAKAQIERLRAMLIQGAARAQVSARQILVELAAHCLAVAALVALVAPVMRAIFLNNLSF